MPNLTKPNSAVLNKAKHKMLNTAYPNLTRLNKPGHNMTYHITLGLTYQN